MEYHTQDILTAEAIEFGEWLTRVAVPAVRVRTLSESRARALTLRLNMDRLKLGASLNSGDKLWVWFVNDDGCASFSAYDFILATGALFVTRYFLMQTW